MPKSESLEKLGSIAFLLGNKELPVEISENDYNSYKSVFTDNIVSSDDKLKIDDLPDIDDLDNLDDIAGDSVDDIFLNDKENDPLDIDNLGLPSDLGDTTDNLDDLGLPSDLGDTADNDLNISDIDLNLPNDIEDNVDTSSIDKVLEDEENDFELPDIIDTIDDVDNLENKADDFEDNLLGDDLDLPSDFDDKENIDKTIDDDFNIDSLTDDLDDNITDDDILTKDAKDIDTELPDIDDINLDDIDDIQDDSVNTDKNKTEDIDFNTDDIFNSLDDIFEEENTKTSADKINDDISEDSEKENKTDGFESELDSLMSDEENTEKEKNEDENKEIQDNLLDDDFDIPDVDLLDLDSDTKDTPSTDIDKENKTDDNFNLDEELKDHSDIDILNSDIGSTEDTIEIPEYDNDTYQAVEEETQEIEENKKADDGVNYEKVLPPPSLADSLKASKYGDIDKGIDIDTVLRSIESLPSLTQFHVLDAILNEKLNEEDMKALLEKLANREDAQSISSTLQKSLGVDIKEHGKKTVADLIPIPEALKDYASIIRTSVLAFAAILIVGLLGFLFVYRPIMSNSYFSRGLKLLNTGAYNEAERLFEKGDRLNPKQIKWYNRYARGYIDRETFNPAFIKIQKALEIKPRDFETRITFGYYYRKKGEKDLDAADYNSGETLYNDMLRITKKKKEVTTIFDERGLLMISRARFLNEPKYLDTAYENYKELIRNQGDSVLARKRGMLIMIYKNNYQQVMALYNYINKLKKDYFDDDVYPILASYVLNHDNFYLARTLFEKIINKYPSNITAITGYADYEMRLKHYDKAKEVLLKSALPLYDKNEFLKGKELIYNMLGQISYNTADYGSAISYFENALKINAIYPDANFNLGNVYYYQQNDYPKAKIYYQTAFANTPPELRTTQLIYNLSWLYYLDKEYDVAFDGFYSIFDKNSKNPVLSYALGNTLLHLEKENLANGFYNNALSLALEKREQLGNLEMRTDDDFYLLSYLAALYNNIGVAYADKYINTTELKNEQEAFKNFVLASEYFDQIRTSRLALQIRDGRTVMLQNQNVGIPLYNLMSMQARKKLNKDSVLIDDFIPKDMYYIKY